MPSLLVLKYRTKNVLIIYEIISAMSKIDKILELRKEVRFLRKLFDFTSSPKLYKFVHFRRFYCFEFIDDIIS